MYDWLEEMKNKRKNFTSKFAIFFANIYAHICEKQEIRIVLQDEMIYRGLVPAEKRKNNFFLAFLEIKYSLRDKIQRSVKMEEHLIF